MFKLNLDDPGISSRIFLSCLHFVFWALFGVKYRFIGKIKQSYTTLKCLLYIKVFIKQAKGAEALAAYCPGESGDLYLTRWVTTTLRHFSFLLMQTDCLFFLLSTT